MSGDSPSDPIQLSDEEEAGYEERPKKRVKRVQASFDYDAQYVQPGHGHTDKKLKKACFRKRLGVEKQYEKLEIELKQSVNFLNTNVNNMALTLKEVGVAMIPFNDEKTQQRILQDVGDLITRTWHDTLPREVKTALKKGDFKLLRQLIRNGQVSKHLVALFPFIQRPPVRPKDRPAFTYDGYTYNKSVLHAFGAMNTLEYAPQELKELIMNGRTNQVTVDGIKAGEGRNMTTIHTDFMSGRTQAACMIHGPGSAQLRATPMSPNAQRLFKE